MSTKLWRTFKVVIEFRNRVYANLPTSPEALRYAVLKSRQSLGLPTEESEVSEEVKELAEALPLEEISKCAFLRDEKGLYMRPRNIKGLLKESLAVIGKRGAELIRHGVHPYPEKIYFLRKADGKYETIKKPDGEDIIPMSVITLRGPRSAVRTDEYIEKPTVMFFVKATEYVLRRLGGAEGLKTLFEVGQEIGMMGRRSLGEGKYNLVAFEEVR